MTNRNFKRTDRISELIQRTLAEIIQNQIKSPGFITLSGLTVSKDIEHAKVYFTVFNADPVETQKMLNTAAGHLRMLLAKSIQLRIMPELHFVYDSSIEYGNRLSKLIDDVNKNTPDEEQ